MAAGGEQAVRRAARVLERPLGVADPEGHRRGLPRHSESLQEPLEARVVAVVEHDEAGVDVVWAVGRIDLYGVRVPAGVGARLEYRYRVALAQEVSDGEAGDARADDGDPHGARSGIGAGRVMGRYAGSRR